MNASPAHNLRDAPSIDQDRTLLTEAVTEAGALALRYFRAANDVALKPDGSQVSEADLAVDAYLRRTLKRERPGYGWLSEETPDDSPRLETQRIWIVDPIDGTRGFVEGKDQWSICAALVQEGEAIAGAVYNPATGELFDAAKGDGARLNGEPISVTDRRQLEGASFLGSAGLFRPNRWKEPWPRIHVRWVSSIAYRMALIGAGRADATMSLGTYADWDLAAATLIVEEAGGKATDASGATFRFNQPVPYHAGMVAAGPTIHAQTIARLRDHVPPSQKR